MHHEPPGTICRRYLWSSCMNTDTYPKFYMCADEWPWKQTLCLRPLTWKPVSPFGLAGVEVQLLHPQTWAARMQHLATQGRGPTARVNETQQKFIARICIYIVSGGAQMDVYLLGMQTISFDPKQCPRRDIYSTPDSCKLRNSFYCSNAIAIEQLEAPKQQRLGGRT